ncbi:MAG: putative quinol monooxygenase [Janthinobacterium lividum]
MQYLTNQYVTVIWEAQAKAGKAAEMKSLITGVITGARNEVGCLDYEAHEVEGQPGTFIIWERWENKAALDRHYSSAQMIEKIPQMMELIEGSIEAGIRFLNPFRPAQ